MGVFKTCLSTWTTIAPAIVADGWEGESAEVPQPKGKAFPRVSRVELSQATTFPTVGARQGVQSAEEMLQLRLLSAAGSTRIDFEDNG